MKRCFTTGRNYDKELSETFATYKLALACDSEAATVALRSLREGSLTSVGSGGTLVTAVLAGTLHEMAFGHISEFLTPLEFACSSPVGDRRVLLVTASGRNKDSLAVIETIILSEPVDFALLTLDRESPAGRLVKRLRYAHVLHPPPGQPIRDGYLATNSTVFFSTFLTRAYMGEEAPNLLPKSLNRLMSKTHQQLQRSAAAIVGKKHVIILHDGRSRAGSVDLESRLAESGLAAPMATDLRNFAHGRHLWVETHIDDTAIVVFVTKGRSNLARATLKQVPKRVPRVLFETGFSPLAVPLAQIVNSMHFFGALAALMNQDPGRPKVPGYGRRLYRLGVQPHPTPRTVRTWAIGRKTRWARLSGKDLGFWNQRYTEYVRNLSDSSFSTVALDYDGTLVETRERFRHARTDVVQAIRKVLAKGFRIGIATGRGKSVREDLGAVIPMNLHGRIWIAYYNGSQISTLDDRSCPDRTEEPAEELRALASKLPAILPHGLTLEVRPHQISLHTEHYGIADVDAINGLVRRLSPSLRLVRSGHTLDILPAHTSKVNLLASLSRSLGCDQAEILRIGDRGGEDGNDYELLASDSALSVDQVPMDPYICWNLSVPGMRGTQATVEYLSALKAARHKLLFTPNWIQERLRG